MFGLSIVDHLRLNLTRTAENYTVHAHAAERLAGLTSRIKISVLALILMTAAASVMSLIEPGRSYRIVTVIAASLACAAYAGYIAFGFEGRVYAHRVCAHKLWLVCERHRALLAEIQDGLLDRASILQRRDELVLETHGAYAQTFPLDQLAYEGARQSVDSKERPDHDNAHADADQLVASSMRSPDDGRETNESVPH